ncbi:MAG: T9SS type A sorting domain-containing protein [Flavobacteriia bacterium]|nr:T9SS type A sorting domain-containing protein [Flavobacteriia bacterium]
MKTLSAFLLILSSLSSFSQDYYFQGGAFDNLSQWTSNSDGSGSNPPSFNTTDLFDLQGNDGTVSSTLTFEGGLTNSGTQSQITITGHTLSLENQVFNPTDIVITGAGILYMNDAGAQDIPIIDGITTLYLSNSGEKTATSDIDVTNLAITGTASLNMGINVLDVATIVNTSGTHTITTSNTSAAPIIGTVSIPSNVNVIYSGSGAMTIPNLLFEGDLTVPSTLASITAGDNFSVNGTFYLEKDLDMGTFFIGGTGTIDATTNNPSFSTANLSGSPFPANSTFYDLTFDGSGAQTLPAGTTVNNDLTVFNSNTVTAAGDLSVENLLSVAGSSTLDMSTYQITGNLTGGLTAASINNSLRSAYTGGLPFPEGQNTSGVELVIELYAAGDQSIPGGGASYLDLVLSGSGVKTISSGALTVGIGSGVLEINPGTALSSPTGTTLTIDGATVTMSADASNYSQLLATGTFNNNSGSYVKEHYLDLSSARWVNIGMGLTGGDLSSLAESGATLVSSSGSTGSVFYWDGTDSNWKNPSLSGNSASVGYTIYAGNANGADFLRAGSGTVSAEGSGITTADTDITLNYHDGTGANVALFAGSDWGWNLIANPYTATYDWDGQTLPSNTNGSIYIWTGTTYASWVSGGGGTNGGTQYIAPGQAFWVQTTATPDADLTLSTSQLTVDQSPAFLKTKMDLVKLQLLDDSGQVLDESVVHFENAATNSFDGMYDAHKLPNGDGIPTMYVDLNSRHYSICTTPQSTDEFPINVESNNGASSLTIRLDDSELESYGTAVLEDLKTGTLTVLTNGGSYSFNQTASDSKERFLLKFYDSKIGIEEQLSNNLGVSVGENQLTFFTSSDVSQIDGVLLDMQGRQILRFDTPVTSDKTTLDTPSLAPGVYIVQYTTNGTDSGAVKFIQQ